MTFGEQWFDFEIIGPFTQYEENKLQITEAADKLRELRQFCDCHDNQHKNKAIVMNGPLTIYTSTSCLV